LPCCFEEWKQEHVDAWFDQSRGKFPSSLHDWTEEHMQQFVCSFGDLTRLAGNFVREEVMPWHLLRVIKNNDDMTILGLRLSERRPFSQLVAELIETDGDWDEDENDSNESQEYS
jgi:hypothetical protein